MHTPGSFPNPEEVRAAWPTFCVGLNDLPHPNDAAVIVQAEEIIASKVSDLQGIARDYILYADKKVLMECADDLYDIDLGFGAEFDTKNDDELREMIDERYTADSALYQLRLGLLGMYRAAEIIRVSREEAEGGEVTQSDVAFGEVMWWDVFEIDASVMFDRVLEFADRITSANQSTTNQPPEQPSN